MSFDLFMCSLIESFGDLLEQRTIETLTHSSSLNLLQKAFTVDDYEVFEQLGDAIINLFIVNYSYASFPFLATKEGVKVVARIRIKYVSCAVLARIAEGLGFWPFIRGVEEALVSSRRQSLLEDVFEAFIGAIAFIIDRAYGHGCGYIVCATILGRLYDILKIDIQYENLFDAKTRLKELCDFYKTQLEVMWKIEKQPDGTNKVFLTFSVDHNSQTLTAVARTKVDAEQLVAQEALDILKCLGLHKAPPSIYTEMKLKPTA